MRSSKPQPKGKWPRSTPPKTPPPPRICWFYERDGGDFCGFFQADYNAIMSRDEPPPFGGPFDSFAEAKADAAELLLIEIKTRREALAKVRRARAPRVRGGKS